jgi:hypothetical protein
VCLPQRGPKVFNLFEDLQYFKREASHNYFLYTTCMYGTQRVHIEHLRFGALCPGKVLRIICWYMDYTTMVEKLLQKSSEGLDSRSPLCSTGYTTSRLAMVLMTCLAQAGPRN